LIDLSNIGTTRYRYFDAIHSGVAPLSNNAIHREQFE
jgi:hypothetical protein